MLGRCNWMMATMIGLARGIDLPCILRCLDFFYRSRHLVLFLNAISLHLKTRRMATAPALNRQQLGNGERPRRNKKNRGRAKETVAAGRPKTWSVRRLERRNSQETPREIQDHWQFGIARCRTPTWRALLITQEYNQHLGS
jgi:hypothetical protein